MSKKLEQDLKLKEIKPSVVSQHCVVHKFKCDLCDADYVGYTAQHLHQCIAEHKYSAIGKQLLDAHCPFGGENPIYGLRTLESYKCELVYFILFDLK